MGASVEIIQFFRDGVQDDILVFGGSNRVLRAIDAINKKLIEWGYSKEVYDYEELGESEVEISNFYDNLKYQVLDCTGKEIIWSETEVDDNSEEL